MLLVVNAGSSSLKAALYEEGAYEQPVRLVSIEGIGSDAGQLVPDGVFGAEGTRSVDVPTHTVAAEVACDWLTEVLGPVSIRAIGHRVVHGGERYQAPVAVSEEVIDYLEAITAMAPNHMPGAISCIKAFVAVYPDVLHVACFDTSFFATIPEVARTLPLPAHIRQLGVRRYGFHGLSYSYLLASFTKHEGMEAANGRIIMAHLGSGASLAACKNGQPVDMTMGFTPISGIVMSTRTGDIEPGVLLYLLREKQMSVDEVATMVTSQSGLLGVSGSTADMYQLLQRQADDADARLAVEVFCNRITKQIGAFAAVLGGVDSIIFTGGIGERSAEIRARVLENLDFLGVEIDDKHNRNGDRLISNSSSRVGVHVIPAREDYMIATQTENILKGGR